ncbi:hypothetical protein PINS_up007434 [Pythium insidiosum]|nr:hypothetical protein PINS_up007434 [Pythium insidiosum]
MWQALSLLLSLVSQPRRLLQLGSSASPSRRVVSLCWQVAFAVSDRLAALTTTHPQTIAPFAHLFLDQLHTIASTAGGLGHNRSLSYTEDAYPPALLDSLCRTMVRLVRHERGMLPLVMITIQKQLIASHGGGGSSSSSASLLAPHHQQQQQQQHVKQLVAVFLAGHVLLERAGDQRDQQSALQAMLKLLSAPCSDATVLHVLRYVSGRLHSALSPSDHRRVAALLDELQQRKGVAVLAFAAAQARRERDGSAFIAGLSGQKDAWQSTSVVLDTTAAVRALRLGQSKGEQITVDGDTKLALLGELFVGRARFAAATDSDRVVDCSFLVPTDGHTTSARLWAHVCALHVAVRSVNLLVEQPPPKTANMTELLRHRRRVLLRVETCWLLVERLQQCLAECQASLDAMKREELPVDDALRQQCAVVLKALDDHRPAWTLAGLSTDAVVAVFEALWKRSTGSQDVLSAPLEAALVCVFSRRLAEWTGASTQDLATTVVHNGDVSIQSLESLVASASGRRAVKCVVARLLETSNDTAAKATALELSQCVELLVAGARQSNDLVLETLAKGALRSLPPTATATLALDSRAVCSEVLFQTLHHATVTTQVRHEFLLCLQVL